HPTGHAAKRKRPCLRKDDAKSRGKQQPIGPTLPSLITPPSKLNPCSPYRSGASSSLAPRAASADELRSTSARRALQSRSPTSTRTVLKKPLPSSVVEAVTS